MCFKMAEVMKRILIIMLLVIAGVMRSYAQGGLNVAPFFTESYVSSPSVTMVSYSGDELESKGISKYKSIAVADNKTLADKIAKAVAKDGSLAKSKEVVYKEGTLYFGFYSMGGKGKHRKYLLYLNRRPAGKEKTTLIYIEGNIDAETVKKMLK